MLEEFLSFLASAVISAIETTGYLGIFFLMALESANIPIPSEVIMPFSGFLVVEGKLSLWPAVFWGAAGNLFGSLVSYYLGFFGGRKFFERWGKFLLISPRDLELADRLFFKYGMFIVFFARVLPVIRTFISFPAGMARMNLLKFSLYTFAGSFLWSFALAYAGMLAGENWEFLEKYFRTFDWAIAILLIAAGVWWIWRHRRHNGQTKTI